MAKSILLNTLTDIVKLPRGTAMGLRDGRTCSICRRPSFLALKLMINECLHVLYSHLSVVGLFHIVNVVFVIHTQRCLPYSCSMTKILYMTSNCIPSVDIILTRPEIY